MLVPRRVRWRTFNFQTIIHQKLMEFPVLVIRTQRQLCILYLRVGCIDPNGKKLQFPWFYDLWGHCSSGADLNVSHAAAAVFLVQCRNTNDFCTFAFLHFKVCLLYTSRCV